MAPFLARFRASISAGGGSGLSSPPSGTSPPPVQADQPSFASLKRRGSLSAGIALLRAKPGAGGQELQDQTGLSGQRSTAAVDRTEDNRPPRVDLELPDVAAAQTAASPVRSAESIRTEEDAVLANLSLNSDEAAELVRTLCGKLSERGLDVPGLYLSAHLQADEEQDGKQALSPAGRLLLLAWVRLHRPNALGTADAAGDTVSEPLTLGIPAPSPAYLFQQEVRYFKSSAALAHLILWVVGRLAPSQARERWFAAFSEAERAGGFAPTAWTDAAKEGEEKRLFQTLAEALSEAAAWERTTGVGLPTLARLVGYSLFRSSTISKYEASKGPAAQVEALIAACEAAGSKVEHIVRAYLRDQAARGIVLPTRLAPLLERYPTPLTSPGNGDHSSKVDSEASSVASAFPSRSRPERALIVVVAAPEGDAGLLRAGATRIDPVRLGTWAINSAATSERRPDRAGLGAEETWQKALAVARRDDSEVDGASSAQGGIDAPTTLVLDDLFAASSNRLVRWIARLYPSAPDPIAASVTNGKVDNTEPIYRPFPKSTSTFFSPATGDSGPQPDLVVSPVPAAPASHAARPSPNPMDPTGSDWMAFSSFGFEGTSIAGAKPAALSLGAGLRLDLGPTDGPPRRLNARSLELERILQSADAGSPPPGSGTLPDPSVEPARPQLLGVSLVTIPEAFPAVLAHALLDPHSVGPSFPTLAVFELASARQQEACGPRWVLVALASPQLATRNSTEVEPAASQPAVVNGRSLSASARRPPPTERRRSGSALAALLSSFGRRQSVQKTTRDKSVDRSASPREQSNPISSSKSPTAVESRELKASKSPSTAVAPGLPSNALTGPENRLGAVIDISRAPSRPREDGTWTPPTLPANIIGPTKGVAEVVEDLSLPSVAALPRSVRESAPSPEVQSEPLPTLPAAVICSLSSDALMNSASDKDLRTASPSNGGPDDTTVGLERLSLRQSEKTEARVSAHV